MMRRVLVVILAIGLSLLSAIPGQAGAAAQVFPLSGNPLPPIAGPDGNVWFLLSNPFGQCCGSLARITPSGVTTTFPLPRNLQGGGIVPGIAVGPDGNLWVPQRELLYKVSMTGRMTQYQLPIVDVNDAIATGSDGRLWMPGTSLSTRQDALAAFDPKTASATVYASPFFLSTPDIAAGPDGKLWVVNPGKPANVAKVTTGGQTTLAKPLGLRDVYGIAAGSDGAMWMLDSYHAERVTTDAEGTLFPLLRTSTTIITSRFTVGHDGALYFTDNAWLERMTTAGVETHVRWFNTGPHGVAQAADGSFWVALANNAIARVRVT
jgi:virginiamycin B lyase